MLSLLITGAAGFVGGNLAVAAASRWQTYLTCHRSPVVANGAHVVGPLDLADRDHVEHVIRQVKPAVIVHAASLSGIDPCEANPERAWQINVGGTKNIAAAARRWRSRLVYLSTDLVFDGRKDGRTPIHVKNLCDVLLECAARPDLQGVLHVAGPQRMSRMDFGRQICDSLGLDRELLIPTTFQNSSADGRRPADCALDCSKARSVLATPIWDTVQGLREMLMQGSNFRSDLLQ
jgi:dTDP-4-dehydrorhamnose reductase